MVHVESGDKHLKNQHRIEDQNLIIKNLSARSHGDLKKNYAKETNRRKQGLGFNFEDVEKSKIIIRKIVHHHLDGSVALQSIKIKL